MLKRRRMLRRFSVKNTNIQDVEQFKDMQITLISCDVRQIKKLQIKQYPT